MFTNLKQYIGSYMYKPFAQDTVQRYIKPKTAQFIHESLPIKTKTDMSRYEKDRKKTHFTAYLQNRNVSCSLIKNVVTVYNHTHKRYMQVRQVKCNISLFTSNFVFKSA